LKESSRKPPSNQGVSKGTTRPRQNSSNEYQSKTCDRTYSRG